MTENKKQFNPFKFILLIIQGAIVGTGTILPGVSGGVLMVAFGIYEPLMDFLSNPIKNFKKYIGFFIPIGIGFVLGFILLAKLVTLLLNLVPALMLMLFAGLIFGTTPELIKSANTTEKQNWSPLVISLAFAFLFFTVLENTSSLAITPNFFWFIFCGLIWGLSLVVPGLSSSSILLLIGLYEPMTDGIGNLDFGVIIPLGIGLIITVLLTVKGVKYLFDKHYSFTIKIIIGIMIASALLIIPATYSNIWMLLGGILCFAVGFIISRIMDISKNKQEQIQIEE